MSKLKIDHKHGGHITSIVAIAHSTYQGRAEWHFVGTIEWSDGSHKKRPSAVHDIYPFMICTPSDGDKTDVQRALDAMNEYLRVNGTWNEDGDWKPHKKSGQTDISL